jgi:nucleotide-binding universal stress UspA family protein
MKTIIAPTDFSKVSLNAVYYAADLAAALNLNLSLLHVCEVHKSFSQLSVPAFDPAEFLRNADEQLKELTQKLSAYTDRRIKIKTEVMIGDVVDSIVEHCNVTRPFVVVMGAETATGLERILFGGKTLSSLRRLSWPLVVVPADIKFTGIKKIGLACDLRKVNETIPVKEINSLIETSHAELFVLHVNPWSRGSFTDETNQEAARLHNIIGKLKPKYRFLEGIDIVTGIVDFVEKNEIDLLIVIPKKRNIVTKFFHDRHSKKLVLKSSVPVMAVHE